MRSVSTPVVREIPIEAIVPNPYAPRRAVDIEEIERLTASIQRVGLLYPILVRPGPGPAVRYILLAGEKRVAAMRRLGRRTIPALVFTVPKGRGARVPSLELILAENMARGALSSIEEARLYAALAATGMPRTEIATIAGRTVATVKNALKLLHLPEAVQALIHSGALSDAHGRALRRYDGFSTLQQRLAELAVAERWSARALETRRLPGAATLLAEGVITRPPLDRFGDLCRHCPFGAFRSRYCLRPDHAAALEQGHE